MLIVAHCSSELIVALSSELIVASSQRFHYDASSYAASSHQDAHRPSVIDTIDAEGADKVDDEARVQKPGDHVGRSERGHMEESA